MNQRLKSEHSLVWKVIPKMKKQFNILKEVNKEICYLEKKQKKRDDSICETNFALF